MCGTDGARKFQINQLALLNGTGRHSRLLRGLLREQPPLWEHFSRHPGEPEPRALSRHFGTICLVWTAGPRRGRLVSLRRAALAGPGLLRRFFRLRLGVLRLFRFRGTATARLFGSPFSAAGCSVAGAPASCSGAFPLFPPRPGPPGAYPP